MSRACKHKIPADHQVAGNPEIWVCSVCSVHGRWARGWCYFGNIECRKCGSPNIEAVYCSAGCAAKEGRKTEGGA